MAPAIGSKLVPFSRSVPRLAVSLPTVTEHDPKHIRLATLALGIDHPRSHPIVDLGLETWCAFHPSHERPDCKTSIVKYGHALGNH